MLIIIAADLALVDVWALEGLRELHGEGGRSDWNWDVAGFQGVRVKAGLRERARAGVER
jgi:hypothetical protein